MKSVPISVRVTQDEAESLARLHIPDAKTPSEKLRFLIAEAHKREQGPADYPESIVLSQQWLAPVFDALQLAESRQAQHSEVIALLREWLPEFLAQFKLGALNPADKEGGLSFDELLSIERGVTERLFRLMERLFQLGLISRCHCYDPELISKRMDLIRQLAAIITQQKQHSKEES